MITISPDNVSGIASIFALGNPVLRHMQAEATARVEQREAIIVIAPDVSAVD